MTTATGTTARGAVIIGTTGADAVNVINRALRAEWRRAGVKGAAGALRALRNDLKEPVSVGMDSQPTASWSWDSSTGRHTIKLGSGALSAIIPARKRTAARAVAVYRGLIRHECAHGRYTDRNTAAVVAELGAHGLPFVLLNMFEDARIEHADRARTGAPFNWARLLDLPKSVREPEGAFSMHSMCEVAAGGKLRGRISSRVDVALVRDFYDRAVGAPDTRSLIPLLVEWVRAFGMPGAARMGETLRPSDKIGDKSDGSAPAPRPAPAGVTAGADGGASEGGEDGEDEDGEDEGTGAGAGEEAAPADKTRGPEVPRELKLGERTLASEDRKALRPYQGSHMGCEFNTVGVQNIVAELGAMIGRAAPATLRNSTSGSRLRIAGAAVGDSSAFRSRTGNGGARKVFAMFDMSGSMAGAFHQDGGAFLLALLALHRSGKIKLTAVLTGGRGFARVPTDAPVSELLKLGATQSNESVDATLSACRADVVAADTVVIYTDGNLTDGNVNAGEWRSRGVDLLGVAVATPEWAPAIEGELRRHFAKGFTAQTGAALARRIMAYTLTGRG